MVTTTKRLAVRTDCEADPNRVQRAVQEQMERVARIRKLVPVHEGFSNDIVTTVGRATYVPILRLYKEFKLSEQEVHDSDVLQATARDAARRLAQAEDLILLFGTPDFHPLEVKESLKKLEVVIDPGRASMEGLLSAAKHVNDVELEKADDPKTKSWGYNTVLGLQTAMTRLTGRSFFSPFGLFLHPDVKQDASIPKKETDPDVGPPSPLKQIKRLLDGDDNLEIVPSMPKTYVIKKTVETQTEESDEGQEPTDEAADDDAEAKQRQALTNALDQYLKKNAEQTRDLANAIDDDAKRGQLAKALAEVQLTVKMVNRPGILFPVDDGSIEIIMAEPAQIVSTGRVAGNLISYSVYERISLRIREPDAIQILSFN